MIGREGAGVRARKVWVRMRGHAGVGWVRVRMKAREGAGYSSWSGNGKRKPPVADSCWFSLLTVCRFVS